MTTIKLSENAKITTATKNAKTKAKVVKLEKLENNASPENSESSEKTLKKNLLDYLNEKVEHYKTTIKSLQKRFNYKDKDLNIALNVIEDVKDEWVQDIPKELENVEIKSHYANHAIKAKLVKILRIPRKIQNGPTESVFIQIYYVDQNNKEYFLWRNIATILGENPNLKEENFNSVNAIM
jgi:uncharacterized FlaG/YvyC family protein